jgi:AIPR protein
MITQRQVDQAYSDLKAANGGVREDYFGLLYLEKEHSVAREKALNQVAFGGHDYGIDGFHFDEQRRNLYLFQFKYSESYGQFKGSLQRLIEDGLERIFVKPNKDDLKNQLLLQLRSCLVENRALIDQVCFRFVFTGDPEEAERSPVLDKLREDLENKKFLIEQFFEGQSVRVVVEFRSASGRVGSVRTPRQNTTFKVPLTDPITVEGPSGEQMYVTFIRVMDLHRMHTDLGPRFFDSNIRYGLGESESVNRAITKALRQIVLDQSDDPSIFAFNHNGITLFSEHVEEVDGKWNLTSPRLLNGAQTVTSVSAFREANKDNPKLAEGQAAFNQIRVPCKVITHAEQKFVTRVTINNNRQNPVEPWNLHANDLIQLELQDKFRTDIGIYYERQENAFDQLSTEDLEEYGITEEGKAIQMLKLTQVFLLTDGLINRLSEMRRVFEDEKVYEQVFRNSRLKADSRHMLLCYKVQFRLRKLSSEIEQKGQNKYWFISRARYLLWALLCQGLLNDDKLEDLAEANGNSMALAADYTDHLTWLATARVRPLLSDLMNDRDYAEKVQEQNLSFFRTDTAFDKCMANAHRKWRWVHKKLV